MYKTVEKKMTVTRRVYRGPSLPFVKDDTLVFLAENEDTIGTNYCNFLHSIEDIVTFELNSIGLDMDYKLDDENMEYGTFAECDDHMFDDDGDEMIVVTLPLKRTPFIECVQCKYAPTYLEKEDAYQRIPLNEDTWDEWVCPDCLFYSH